MSNFRTFRDFFHFNKEVVYLITMGYIVLIFIMRSIEYGNQRTESNY